MHNVHKLINEHNSQFAPRLLHFIADMTFVNTFAARLTSRGIVRVQGEDSLTFLQSLITNDIHQICLRENSNSCATAFLNPRGRLLFAALIHRPHQNHYLIDTERMLIPHLIKHLTHYRLRAKLHISDESHHHAVWSFVNTPSVSPDEHHFVFSDPRLHNLGLRAILPHSFVPPHHVHVADEHAYTRLRILHGVPDGPDFHHSPLPLHLALHVLNAVSFNKGCYLGQELTARSHFTGVLRKRITPLILHDSAQPETNSVFDAVSDASHLRLPQGTQLFVEGKEKSIGNVTSSVDNIGVAVLPLSDVFSEQGTKSLRLSDGREVRPFQPQWWSQQYP